MATYSSNSTIKIGSLSHQATSSTSATLTFTVPASSYAICSLWLSSGTGTAGTITVAGQTYLTAASATVISLFGLYAAAGCVVTVNTSSTGSNNAFLEAVSFLNSP